MLQVSADGEQVALSVIAVPYVDGLGDAVIVVVVLSELIHNVPCN